MARPDQFDDVERRVAGQQQPPQRLAGGVDGGDAVIAGAGGRGCQFAGAAITEQALRRGAQRGGDAVERVHGRLGAAVLHLRQERL